MSDVATGPEIRPRTAPAGATGSGAPTIATIVAPAPRTAWKELAGADPLTIPSQSAGWTDAMVATGRFRDRSRLYTFSDGRRFVIPLVEAAGATSRIGGLSSLPNAWGSGGVIGDTADAAVMKSMMDDLVGLGAMRLLVRPNPLQTEAVAAALPVSRVEIPRRAHLVELPDDTDTLWKHLLSGKSRRSVNRAERSGVRVEHGTGEHFATIYHSLLPRSVEHWAGRQHEPEFLARFRANRRDPLSKWTAIARHLDGDCHFYVGYLDDDPIAAIVVLRQQNAHYTRSVMDKARAAPVAAGHLLLHRAMHDAVEHGCRWFHMGESGTNAGLAHFKEKFGAVAHDHADFLVERLPITAADRMARSAVKKLLRFKD